MRTPRWPAIGGAWAGYGVPVATLMMGRDYAQTAASLRTAMPQSHLAFLGSLRTSVTVGKYFLCHAGVRPGVPLEHQSEQDLLWIRDEFLSSRVNFGRIVVHGHTPCESPEFLPNRINVDTGAFMTGQLTCAVLEKESARFLSTALDSERSTAFRP